MHTWAVKQLRRVQTDSPLSPFLGPVVGALLGLCYGVLIAQLGALLTGAGHGSYLFLTLGFGPGGCSLVLLSALGVFAGLKPDKFIARIGLALLLAYYLVAWFGLLLANEETQSIIKVASAFPVLAALTSTLYIGGQMMFLHRFITGLKS